MIKYMKPLKMFQETMKRTIDMRRSVFIGFNVTDKNVSLAVSDRWYMGAIGLCVLPRDQNLLDNLVSKVQDCGADLEGIIVASEYHDRAKDLSHLWKDKDCIDISSAVHMLQANLDVLNTLVERVK